MLLRITEFCTMNCNHCMINASTDGKHMSEETFIKSLNFIQNVCIEPLFISGGEPTDHPQFFEFIDIALKKEFFILVMSNGLWVNDEIMRKKIFTLVTTNDNISFQITNDKRYYPKQIPIINHDKCDYETQLRVLSPFGRAVTNNLPTTAKYPFCFNLRSLVNTFKSLPAAIMYLRKSSKFCTPSINIDGSISAGESNQCYKIGDINQSFELITNQILNMHCNKCGLESNLLDIHKKAINIV